MTRSGGESRDNRSGRGCTAGGKGLGTAAQPHQADASEHPQLSKEGGIYAKLCGRKVSDQGSSVSVSAGRRLPTAPVLMLGRGWGPTQQLEGI